MTRSMVLRFFVTVSLLVAQSKAEWTNATCTQQLWSFNSLQQSPCLVASYIGSPCMMNNNWLVPELRPEWNRYLIGTPNKCTCNSVMWNVISACSLCQGKLEGYWSEWISNCSSSDIVIGGYPLQLPSGVAVPHWAYYDFTPTGVFNAPLASQQVGPESTAPPGASSTLSAPTSTSTTTIPTSSPKNTNTGAIIGGAVAGAVGLILIVAVIFVLVRKNRRDENNNPVPQHAQDTSTLYSTPPNSTVPMVSQYQPGMVQVPGHEQQGYNFGTFSDPSKLSNNPADGSYYNEQLLYSHQPQPYSPYSGPSYNGKPEL